MSGNKGINPKVSVIMPAYNAEATIDQSIQSVLDQTYQNWELIIVNDASTDNTLAFVQKNLPAFIQKNLLVIENPTNQGVAASRNTAISHASGQYLAFLDSDDMWLPDKLEKQVKLMNDSNVAISYTGTSYINAAGQVSGYTLPARARLSYKELLRRNIMSCSSVMVRRDCMVPFPITANTHEDYVVWLQIVKEHGYAYGLDEPLLVYRVGDESKSSGRIRSAVMTFNAYRAIGYGRVAATVVTLRYSLHSIAKRVLIRLGRVNANARS